MKILKKKSNKEQKRNNIARRRGETGRHVRFRSIFRKDWGFESPRRQVKKSFRRLKKLCWKQQGFLAES